MIIGYYHHQFFDPLPLLHEVCGYFGATLKVIDGVPDPSVAVLIWYVVQRKEVPSLTEAEHRRQNIVFLVPRWPRDQLTFGKYFPPLRLYEHHIVFPFDPKELACRIVTISLERGYHEPAAAYQQHSSV